MAGLVCQCSDVMMASCDVDSAGGGSLCALLLCMLLAAWAGRSMGCCDGYESDAEEETDASKSMFS
jgi:hypothetical protein